MSIDKVLDALKDLDNVHLAAALVIVFLVSGAWLGKLVFSRIAGNISSKEHRERQVAVLAVDQIEHDRKRLNKYDQNAHDEEIYNRTYRHALNNRLTALAGYYELYRELLIKIRFSWPKMPDEFKAEMDTMPTVHEINRKTPLPDESATDG